MNNIKQQITELVNTKPRHYAKIIKNNIDFLTEIESCNGNSIAEKTYNYLYGPINVTCVNNNNKKFKSVTEGYKFCGPANVCKCANNSVATKCKDLKGKISVEQQTLINKKRSQTTMEKYGVSNNAQTSTAKEKHFNFYQNTDNVKETVSKSKKTKKERYGTETYNNSNKIKETFRKKYNSGYWIEKYPDKEIEMLQDKNILTELYRQYSVSEIAEKCSVHIQTVYRYLNFHELRDPYKSTEEQEIVNFLNSLGIYNIVRNSRSIIDTKKELDIFLPDFNIAIEYNGVYWHHEDITHITRSYHYDKFKSCEQKGIQLLTIFSNFWHSKKEIVKEVIRNKLGVSNKLTAYARQCQIREVSSTEARVFLNNFHIQGYTTSTIRYGLYFKDTLVSIMTFGKNRAGAGIGKADQSHELIRFASCGRVPGAASRLLKHFIRSHSPTKIVSYSDNEWSTGQLYQTLNFQLEKNIPPSYWYLKPKEEKLYHRYNFAKYKLIELGYSSDLTERQITKQMGLLKIWDCGKRRWVLDF